MQSAIRMLVKRLRVAQGALDAATGIPPQRTTRYYLQGYAEQYAKEQITTAQSLAPF